MTERINHDNYNSDDDNILPKGVESLSDYTPYKLHLLLSTPLPIDIPIEEEEPLSIINDDQNNNNSSDLQVDKPPSRSRKRRNLLRYFIPISRSRSSSVEYESKKSYEKQQSNEAISNLDRRFFIIRHGERVDRYFGANWYKLAFDPNDQYRPYHRNFPPSLPLRSNSYHWALDSPLTFFGLTSAERLGRIFRSKHYQPDYVYSSPAMRCILTTIQILKGLKLENKIPIRIEPGLLEYGVARFGMEIFFQPTDWHKYGINIDLSYQPILTQISPSEREDQYYLRSKHVIREIEKRHENSLNQLLNIFIIAHATSPETLTWDLIGKQPNVNDLYKLSLQIAYLQMVITERKQENKLWSSIPIRWL